MDLQEFSLISCSCPTGNDLYSATSINFLGSEPVVLRSSDLALRTEFKSSWLSGEFLLCRNLPFKVLHNGVCSLEGSACRNTLLKHDAVDDICKYIFNVMEADQTPKRLFSCFVIPEPNFVYMDFVRESFNSLDGDDDKVYLFFSENAMEYDFYSKVIVSRVARVCKV